MRAAWVVLCSLLTWTTLVVCFVVWLPIMAVLHAVERPFDSGLYRTGRFFRLMGIVIARANPLWHFRAEGYVPPDPRHPFVVVSNHESFADILLTCFLPWEMKWLGKAELFRIPIMGQVMWLAGDIPVRRGERTSAREAMAACRDRLRKRVSVMIYPEGTRTRTGEMLPFKDGAFRLAIDAQVPVLPLVCVGTREAIRADSWKVGPARGVVHVLEPVPTTGLTSRDTARLREQVRSLILAKRDELRRGMPPSPAA